jgi:hypothetical protein
MSNPFAPHLIAVALPCLVAACAAPHGLRDYPRRTIDRPYTLPAGTRSLSAGYGVRYTGPGRQRHVSAPDQPIPPRAEAELEQVIRPPVVWDLALTPRLTLTVLAILPVGVRAELMRSERHQLGATLGLVSAGGSSIEGAFAEGTVAVFDRARLGRDLALESYAAVDYLYRERRGDAMEVTVSAGPRLQLSDAISLRPSAGAIVEVETSEADLRAFVDAHADWNFHCRWDAALYYSASPSALGYARSRHTLTASVRFLF